MLFTERDIANSEVFEQSWTTCSYVAADSVYDKLAPQKNCFAAEGVSLMLFY
jgi:hypothetical protein